MSDDQIPPAGTVIRIHRRDDPVGAVTEDDAVHRAAAYPNLRMGGPLFGHAEDLGDGRWRIGELQEHTPQAARDAMAHRFRERLAETTEPELVTELLAVGQILDWRKVDEVTVAGRRYRIIRADTFARFGPDGPESPRPSDPDPHFAPNPNESRTWDDLVVDPNESTGMAHAVLKIELLPAHYPKAGVPAEVYDDSLAAVHRYPGGVMLPTQYAVAEYVDGRWQPGSRAVDTPQDARDEIAFDLRYLVQRLGNPTAEEVAAYAKAADDLDATRADELTVLGRRFRVTRIEALLRFGPDGPEPPRPSDHDPDPPPEAHFADLRRQGLLPEPE